MSKFIHCSIILLLSFSFLHCGKRVPSLPKAQSVMSKRIEKYGKKYTETKFSGSKVSRVEILSVDELQKNLVSVAGKVHMENGNAFQVRMTMIRKYPLGWRSQGWENLGEELY